MSTKERFLPAPLYLMREFFIKPDEVMRKIIQVGIYNYGKRNYSDYQANRENIAKQLMYGFYRDKNFNGNIYDKIQGYADDGTIDLDEDYKGFNGYTFNPEFELPGVLKILDIDENLRNYAIDYHGVKIACGDQNLNINAGSKDWIITESKQILSKMPPGDPWIMVNEHLAFVYRDNKKQDFELAQFAAHIAIKSIVGTKPYCKTNKQLILSRMFGYASAKHIPAKLPKDIQPLYNKYATRWWMDKVLQMVELNWGVKIYSRKQIKGFYVSTSKNIDMDNLADKAENQTLKNRIAKLKREKEEARKKAQDKINSMTTTSTTT